MWARGAGTCPRSAKDMGGSQMFAYKRLFSEDSPGGKRDSESSPCPLACQPSPRPTSDLCSSASCQAGALGPQPMSPSLKFEVGSPLLPGVHLSPCASVSRCAKWWALPTCPQAVGQAMVVLLWANTILRTLPLPYPVAPGSWAVKWTPSSPCGAVKGWHLLETVWHCLKHRNGLCVFSTVCKMGTLLCSS